MLFFGRGNRNLIAKKRDKVVFCCTDMYAEPGSESGTPPRSRKGHHSGRGELSDRKAPEHGPRTGKGHTYYFVSKLLPPQKKKSCSRVLQAKAALARKKGELESALLLATELAEVRSQREEQEVKKMPIVGLHQKHAKTHVS